MSSSWSTLRTHVLINLDCLKHNLDLMRSYCEAGTRLMPVLKGNAYGHGAIPLARFLATNLGIERLAVSTLEEGKMLRQAAIPGPIQMLGAMPPESASESIDYGLIPTLCYQPAVDRLKEELIKRVITKPFKVHVSIDTGMGRIGVKPKDLHAFIENIERDGRMVVEGIFSHFADSWGNPEFTRKQLAVFEEATSPYRGLKLRHISNSGAIVKQYGTDYDLVRPGISMYGQPADALKGFPELGFKPLLSWIGYPTMVKELPRGHSIGYGRSYIVNAESETIATIPVGYADGLRRSLSNTGHCIRHKTKGDLHEIVGRISMDQVTVRVPKGTTDKTEFLVYTADFSKETSPAAIAEELNTVVHELLCAIAVRVPRLYRFNDADHYATPEGHLMPVRS